jgi:osmotically-inducible protein OsmY
VRPLLLALIAALTLGSFACRSLEQEDDLSDQATKVRLEAVLRGRRDLDLKYVTVDVNAGAATISGLVPNGEQLRTIRRLAAKVRGVDQVLNNLIIQE